MKTYYPLLFLLIGIQACDPDCLDGGNDTTIQIEVPFEVSPQKEVYQIGDTITLSLFMEEYYSLSTKESIHIKENLIKNYIFSFYDSAGYKHPPDLYSGIDSFNYLLDSNSIKFYSSTGKSGILFIGNLDSKVATISYTAKIIPIFTGFYILNVAWAPSSRSTNLIDLTDDCGKEYYTLESMINDGKKDLRNTHLVENDTMLLRQTLDGFLSDLSIDSILNIPHFYYFYVEE